MVSWNVNGWHRKKYTIEEFMQKECITIMVVQETLVSLTITEILQWHHLYGLSTIGVFVNKAYNKVYHGALYCILGHMGVSGHLFLMVDQKHVLWI